MINIYRVETIIREREKKQMDPATVVFGLKIACFALIVLQVITIVAVDVLTRWQFGYGSNWSS